MAFSVNLTSLFSSVASTANDAALVAEKAQTYIVLAEQTGAALKLSGPQKLDMVKQMLLADINSINPSLAAELGRDWQKISGIISGAIAFFNFIGWAFSVLAPFIEQAVPASIPAVTAIQAAQAAVAAAEKAAQSQGS